MGEQPGNTIDPARVPTLIRESFSLVEGIQEKVAAHFYALIFLEHPEVRDMFPPMMDVQRDRLIQALVRVVAQCEHPETLADYLRQLGRDHRKFGARPEHYDVVWRCLITALKYFAGRAWTPEMDAAWLAAYQLVAGTMIQAAEEDARVSPAWWTARVVHHERRTRDIAVITLQPDQPYSFRPGQYLSVESQRWPRVWRHYSIANAPRPDGTITLHVRAVPAGWVSNALVNHTAVGDVVRLGPPLGTMFCNTMSARDILCVAGGTGLAPIKAILEDLAGWNTNRRVRLFFGARRGEEHYDTADLMRLTERYHWLSLVTPVSHDPRFPGERGMLPDVVARHGEFHDHWAGHDVYVSGSVPMVRATIARLQELDIPLANIRFDAYGGMDGLWQPSGGAGGGGFSGGGTTGFSGAGLSGTGLSGTVAGGSAGPAGSGAARASESVSGGLGAPRWGSGAGFSGGSGGAGPSGVSGVSSAAEAGGGTTGWYEARYDAGGEPGYESAYEAGQRSSPYASKSSSISDVSGRD